MREIATVVSDRIEKYLPILMRESVHSSVQVRVIRADDLPADGEYPIILVRDPSMIERTLLDRHTAHEVWEIPIVVAVVEEDNGIDLAVREEVSTCLIAALHVSSAGARVDSLGTFDGGTALVPGGVLLLHEGRVTCSREVAVRAVQSLPPVNSFEIQIETEL